MASGNRVEELESKVRELEATVSGLTDELVETRERLHALEDELDPEVDIIEGKPTRSQSASNESQESSDGSAEEAKADGDDAADEADSESSDDIIVA